MELHVLNDLIQGWIQTRDPAINESPSLLQTLPITNSNTLSLPGWKIVKHKHNLELQQQLVLTSIK